MPQTIDDLFMRLPDETRAAIKKVWEVLPESERAAFQNLLTGIPVDSNLLKMLVDMAIVQFRQAFGSKNSVAIVGPANVGKSTLYNQFVRAKADQAAVSPIPGTTRANQAADAGLFTIVDTPGADAVGTLGEAEKRHALEAAEQADFLIIMFDAIQGIKRTEQELFNELTALGKPYVVVLNKIDLIKREEPKVIAAAAGALALQPEQIIPLSALSRKNFERILSAVAVAEPQIMVALGRAMPQYRAHLAWRATVSAASMSAVIALTPLPFIDFAPLVITQAAMVLTIARIYNYKVTLARARELVATFGLGLLGRSLFAELSKAGGLPGWLLAAAVAASTTVAMGYAARIWFESGERVTNETLAAITKNTTRVLLGRLSRRKGLKQEKESLQAGVSEALKDLQPGDQPPASEDNNPAI